MKTTIAKIAERVLGYYFNDESIEINEGCAGKTVQLYTCVKAYGDGWTAYFDSRDPYYGEPGLRTIDKGPEAAKEIMRKYPEFSGVTIMIEGD